MRSCVRQRVFAFVRVRIIKRPDASTRMIGTASGRVFSSRTFEMYYTYLTGKDVSLLDEVLTQVDHAAGQDLNNSTGITQRMRKSRKGRGTWITLETHIFQSPFFRISDPTECGTVRYKVDQK